MHCPDPLPLARRRWSKAAGGYATSFPYISEPNFDPAAGISQNSPTDFRGVFLAARNPRLDAAGDPRSVKLEGGVTAMRPFAA
jgi:hypothetical protein